MKPETFKVGDRVTTVVSYKSSQVGTVVEICSASSSPIAVEFTGPEWFYPQRSWFAEWELAKVLP